MNKLLLGVTALATLAGAGYLAYNHYNSQPEEVTRKPRGRPRKK